MEALAILKTSTSMRLNREEERYTHEPNQLIFGLQEN